MPTIEKFGKADSGEVIEFVQGADDCDTLAKLLRKNQGVIDIPIYINAIDTAVALIDSIFALKAKLEADKVILQSG